MPEIQGSIEGVTTDGVALTMKHFPGGGARENGFDPHYKAGQWNVYSTKDSLTKDSENSPTSISGEMNRFLYAF